MRWVRPSIIAVAVLAGCVAVVYGVVGRRPTVMQPIAFNHAVHVGEASLTCVDCHTDGGARRDAGLPGKQICLDCHDPDQEAGQHPQKDALFGFAQSDAEVRWIRVTVTRPDVFFSHRRHVAAAQMDCLDCHVDQASLTAPPTSARLVLKMTGCIECHERNAVSTDCLVCHR